MVVNIRSKEASYIIYALLALAFLATVFKERLGLVYGLFMFIDLTMLVLMTPKLNMNVIGGNTLKSIAYAIGAYVLLIIIHTASATVLQGITPTWQGMIEMTRPQSTLALAGSKFLEGFSTVFLVAFIETRVFFGRLFEFFATQTKTSLKVISFRLILLMSVIAGIFTWFHINVRGISNSAWLITFVFAMLSLYLVYKFKETESAVHFHWINNGVAWLR